VLYKRLIVTAVVSRSHGSEIGCAEVGGSKMSRGLVNR